MEREPIAPGVAIPPPSAGEGPAAEARHRPAPRKKERIVNHRWILGLALAGVAWASPYAPTASAQEGPDAPLPQRPKSQPGQTTVQAGPAAPLSEDEKIVHFLNRFSPGATPALVTEVREEGIAKWLDRQCKGEIKESDWFFAYLKKFDSVALTSKQVVQKYNQTVPDSAPEEAKRRARELQETPGRELQSWILARAVYSNRHVREAAADFFRNHFSISIDKDDVKFLAPEWELEIIKAHSLGNFGDMLVASAHHPAMLYYLDNHISRSPPPPGELRTIEQQILRKTRDPEQARQAVTIARQRGLNENYARELMELHTLGVDRYYTQDDVVSLAKVLTGWTIDRDAWAFRFDRDLHCSEKKLFLGNAISTKAGTTEGDLILDLLRRHPGTAQFLSWKLCRFFVNDEPDPAMVKRIAGVFRSSRGDLPKVYAAITNDPEFFNRRNFRDKYKRPYEFVVSAIRATGAIVERWEAVIDALGKMNESPYRCQDPTGYYDQAEAWRDPGAIATRWVFATRLAANQAEGIRIPDTLYSDLPEDKPEEWMDRLIAKILPGAGVSESTYRKLRTMMDAELKRNPRPARPALGATIVGILLGSPDFQKQ